MPNNETTTKFRADVSELVKGMQTAKRQIALANAEFKSATAGLDDWGKSADGVSAKLVQLDKTLKNQKDILKSLEDQYELTVKEMGEGSKEAENLKIKIENQKASISKTEKQIDKFNDTLNDVTEAEKKSAKTGKDVADILDEMDKKADDAGDGFTVLKGAVAGFVGNLASSAIGTVKDMIGTVMGLADETREYRDQMNKLNSAGEEAGYGADYAKKKYTDLYGVLGDETATTTAVNNLIAMGGEQKTLDSILNSSMGIWAKYGDSIPLDGLMESINETSRVSKITGNLADALNWAGVSEDAFNEKLAKCTSEQERQELIASTLDSLYGDLSKSYQESNKSIIDANKANAEYTDNMAEMGARVEPIMTTIREGFSKILGKVLELTEDADFNAFSEKVKNGFDYFINKIIPKVVEGFQWIIDHKTELIGVVAGVGSAFVAWKVVSIVTGVTKAIKAWKVATEGMTVAQKLLNLAMKANVIGIVVSLIAGLVTAFVVLWNKSDAFRNFWINLWNKLKTIVSNGAKAIATFFSNLWTGIKTGASNAWNWITSLFTKLSSWFNNSVIKPIVTYFTNLWTNIKTGASNAWTAVKNVFSNVTSWFKNAFSNAWTAVKNVFSGWGEFFDGLWSTIKRKFGSIGSNLAEAISSSVKSGLNSMIRTIENTINKGIRLINSAIKLANKLPGVDVSTIKEISLPRLARGGIVNSPILAQIGEAGKEAVLPLENNTGWLDEIASRIVAKGGLAGGHAQSVVNNYNYEFNQTNNSPKSLSRLEIYRQTKNQINFAKVRGAHA